MDNKKILYHFTSIQHITHIMEDGYLCPTPYDYCDNKGRLITSYATWFTDIGEHGRYKDLGLNGSILDKMEFRIEVLNDNIEWWIPYSKRIKANFRHPIMKILWNGRDPYSMYLLHDRLYSDSFVSVKRWNKQNKKYEPFLFNDPQIIFADMQYKKRMGLM